MPMRQHEFDEVGNDKRQEEVRLENKKRQEVEERGGYKGRDERRRQKELIKEIMVFQI